MHYAVNEMSNAELLALTLKEKKGEDVLMKFGGSLRNLSEATLEDLIEIGMTRSNAVKMLALMQLAKRYSSEPLNRPRICCPSDIVDLCRDMMMLENEVFRVLVLNTKNHVLAVKTISTGILDACLSHPRSVYRDAIARNGASIAVLHNHPSSDPEPSRQDIELTERLKKAGEILGINLIDHIIIGGGTGRYASLKEKGLM